jgi:hypothetical protein
MQSTSWPKKSESHHRVAGYCCVFMAAAYVVTIAGLVVYLIVGLPW